MNILSELRRVVWSPHPLTPSPKRRGGTFKVSFKVFLWICLGLLLNLIIAPVILASANDHFTRGNAYALGLLGILTLALGIYLSIVIFQPEKF